MEDKESTILRLGTSATTTAVDVVRDLTGRATPPTPADHTVLKDIGDAAERLFLSQAQIAIDHGAAYGGCIIALAGLHFLAGIAQSQHAEINGPEFGTYCDRFLPGYDANALWASLRCGLFHRGVAVGGTDKKGNRILPVIPSDDDPSEHDPAGARGYVLLVVRVFVQDLRASLKAYLAAAACEPSLMDSCRYWHQYYRPEALPR